MRCDVGEDLWCDVCFSCICTFEIYSWAELHGGKDSSPNSFEKVKSGERNLGHKL